MKTIQLAVEEIRWQNLISSKSLSDGNSKEVKKMKPVLYLLTPLSNDIEADHALPSPGKELEEANPLLSIWKFGRPAFLDEFIKEGIRIMRNLTHQGREIERLLP